MNAAETGNTKHFQDALKPPRHEPLHNPVRHDIEFATDYEYVFTETYATLQQLNAHPPEVVVITKSFLEDNLDQHPIVTWANSHYRPFALQPPLQERPDL